MIRRSLSPFLWLLLVLATFSTTLCATERRPLSIIFLDIDGVLMGARDLDPLRTRIRQKLVQLFGKKDDSYREYTELEWRIAASHFLSKEAVDHLQTLIERASRITDIGIVLSSAWRLDGTLFEIKHQVFAMYPFAKRIIDKTPEDDWWRKKRGEVELSPIALKKYGFPLKTRGAQIDYWLRENRAPLGIRNFVIIDDVDDEMRVRHSSHFIEVEGLFSQIDAERAYHILTQF